MGFSSISNFSLYSHSQFHNPKFLKYNAYYTLKPPLIIQTHIPRSPCSLSNLQPTTDLCVSPFSSHQLTDFLKKIPISSPVSCSLSTQKGISKFLSEKIVILLLGSFIFLGFLSTKPVLAQQSSFSETTERKRETQDDKIEDEEMYEKLLEKNPRNVEVLMVLLTAKMKKGKSKEAVKYVERLIVIEPNEVEWRLLQALCYEMMGQLSKSKRLFKEILKKRPLLLRALHGLAMVMHKNLEGPAVFEMLSKALEIARREKRVIEERNIRILIAQMHVVKGELEEGLKDYQDLIDENPADFRPYLCQGIVYSLLDKKKEAEEQFETYRSLVPKEFPQRGFLDDVVLAAKTESRQQLEEEFGAEYSHKK